MICYADIIKDTMRQKVEQLKAEIESLLKEKVRKTFVGVKQNRLNVSDRKGYSSISVRSTISYMLKKLGYRIVPAGKPLYFEEPDKGILGMIASGMLRVGPTMFALAFGTPKGIRAGCAIVDADKNDFSLKVRFLPENDKERKAIALRVLMGLLEDTEIREKVKEFEVHLKKGEISVDEVEEWLEKLAKIVESEYFAILENFKQKPLPVVND